MDAICTATLNTFREQERAFLAVLDGLSNDAVNWQPGPETNAIAVLITHAWGAAQAWTARAAGEEIARDRAAEFRVTPTTADLRDLLQRGGRRIAEYVAAIDPATYGDVRYPPGDQRPDDDPYTVARCLIHAIEHAQEHLGQTYLTRQLWEQRG